MRRTALLISIYVIMQMLLCGCAAKEPETELASVEERYNLTGSVVPIENHPNALPGQEETVQEAQYQKSIGDMSREEILQMAQQVLIEPEISTVYGSEKWMQIFSPSQDLDRSATIVSDDAGEYVKYTKMGSELYLYEGPFYTEVPYSDGVMPEASALLLKFRMNTKKDFTLLTQGYNAGYGPDMPFNNTVAVSLPVSGGVEIDLHSTTDESDVRLPEAEPEAFVFSQKVWYYLLLTIDNDSNFRLMVWDGRNPDNAISYTTTLSEWHADGKYYLNSNWGFEILVGNGEDVIDFDLGESYLIDCMGFVTEEDLDKAAAIQASDLSQAEVLKTASEVINQPKINDALNTESWETFVSSGPGEWVFTMTEDDSGKYTNFSSYEPDIRIPGPVYSLNETGEATNALLLKFRVNAAEKIAIESFGKNIRYGWDTPIGNGLIFTLTDSGSVEFDLVSSGDGCDLILSEGEDETFTLEPGFWYYLLLTVNFDSELRFKVWQGGNSENEIYFKTTLSDWHEDGYYYEDTLWNFSIYAESQTSPIDFDIGLSYILECKGYIDE